MAKMYLNILIISRYTLNVANIYSSGEIEYLCFPQTIKCES